MRIPTNSMYLGISYSDYYGFDQISLDLSEFLFFHELRILCSII